MCGGGIPIVSDVVDFVGDTLDKADNWTEGAGEMLADIDPGPAIGDALADFDKEVLQKADVGTLATVAAIATGNAYLVPYISAANTAVKGGDIGDIATSFGISYVTTNFAPDVAGGVREATAGTLGTAGSNIAGQAAAGAFTGAGAGAATAAAFDKSIGEFATRGAVVGGITGGVSGAVSEGYGAIKNELGIGSSYTPNQVADAEFIADSASGLRAQGIGQNQMVDILAQEGVDPFVAADAASLAWNDVGQAAIAQNLAGSYSANEMFTPPAPTENAFEKQAKKAASEKISGEIIESIYGSPTMPAAFLRYRSRRSVPGMGDVGDVSGMSSPELTQVGRSDFELRKFANDAGDTTLISFKDDEPQTPIPPGYREVERIGAAEGGLIDSSKTTMVKYSKTPLLAPRKKVTKPKKEKIASKGLAVKK